MAELGSTILEHLSKHNGPVSSLDLAEKLHVNHQTVVGAVKSLQGFPGLIIATQKSHPKWILTPEGTDMVTYGSHEYRVLQIIPEEGLRRDDIENALPSSYGKTGINKAKEKGWVEIDGKAAGGPMVRRKKNPTDVKDEMREFLNELASGDSANVTDSMKKDIKKRKLADEQVITSYDLEKGPNFSTSVSKGEADLTVEMLTKDAWKGLTFKDYNFDSLGVPPTAGYFHPLLKVRAEFRQIFLEMGFVEMPTNRFVESSFWNFDALFVPQQHPARDVQDTFFVSDPADALTLPEEYMEKVKKVHCGGSFDSKGYQSDWQRAETTKNVLRTHTTAISARMLYELAQQKEFKPAKYFSIDRVFRNENLDATHLAEFHQIEGVVADYNLSLGHLRGILEAFFKKLGMHKLRFKPAFNPYTEPSMEVFSYHEGLKKWVEVGNSGVFRPEMLLPMGLPADVSVIAWGLSLERPTMIKYGVDNIRDLVGHKVDLNMVQRNPICVLEEKTTKHSSF